LVAVTVSPDTVPSAPTRSPTHTSANDAVAVPGATKVVDVLTSTVSVVLFQAVTVKAPESPALPHDVVPAEPFTEATVPKAPAGATPSWSRTWWR